MKFIKLLYPLLFCCLVGLSTQPQAAHSTETDISKQAITLDVQNFTCSMCKYTIKKALKAINGVEKVTVDADTQTATVQFDPHKTAIEALIKATTQAGYPSTVRN